MKTYGWGARFIGRAIDMLHTSCKDILDNIELIHEKNYMMHVFDELIDDIT